MKSLVSIIIVNWNGKKWLEMCLPSLYKQEYKNIELILVDNASIDGSVEWVQKRYPKTIIVKNEKNEGFANANNRGFKKARGEYVLFLNNDTKVTDTFLTELIKVFEEDPNVGCVQSKILLMDKPDTHDSVGAYLTPTGFLYHFGFGKKNTDEFNKQFDLYTAKGACMCFKKYVLDAVAIDGNVFDPSYFAYFEETDLCHRVWLAGYTVKYAYKSIIYHKMGATSSGMNNAFVQFHSFKNRLATYLKNLNVVHVITIGLAHFIVCEVFAFVSLCNGKLDIWLAIQKAFLWNLTHLRMLLSKRYYVQQSIRKQTDASFWKYVYRTPPMLYYWHWMRGEYTAL